MIAYCSERDDNFYFTAFMLEAWIGMAITKAVEQYAEHKSGDRHLQTGTAWEAWQFVFGHAAPEEWPHIMESLGRFANCDSPDAEIAGRMLSLAMEEDKHGEAVFFQTHLRQTNGNVPPKEERLRLARYAFKRMSEWLEAILHWRAHWMSARAPITNQPTEEQRELAHVGIMQGGYAGLSEYARNGGDFVTKSWRNSFMASGTGCSSGKHSPSRSGVSCGSLLWTN